MIICDLCGEAKDCLQKEIAGKEYDICSECWNQLAQRLKGKGRVMNRETVFLPSPGAVKGRENDEPKPLPGEPPKIWGGTGRDTALSFARSEGADVSPVPTPRRSGVPQLIF